jgi:hypothetical protein
MKMRVFGRTGMQLSMLGFGCGAVGGLMVRVGRIIATRTLVTSAEGQPDGRRGWPAHLQRRHVSQLVICAIRIGANDKSRPASGRAPRLSL